MALLKKKKPPSVGAAGGFFTERNSTQLLNILTVDYPTGPVE